MFLCISIPHFSYFYLIKCVVSVCMAYALQNCPSITYFVAKIAEDNHRFWRIMRKERKEREKREKRERKEREKREKRENLRFQFSSIKLFEKLNFKLTKSVNVFGEVEVSSFSSLIPFSFSSPSHLIFSQLFSSDLI
jgi:hypothetical protein